MLTLSRSSLHRHFVCPFRLKTRPVSTVMIDHQRNNELSSAISAVKAKISKISPNGKVRLVAVSKLKPASDIRALYNLGHRHFGENYVQELLEKSNELPRDIHWHFIGSLQSNKCKFLASQIPNLFAIETVDTRKKANLLNKEREYPDKKPGMTEEQLRVFVQVNTSGEGSKSGVDPSAALELASFIYNECKNLKLLGLMTIGSITTSHNHDVSNEDFQFLVRTRDEISAALGIDLELSMGMSEDYQEAICMGSTNVRVGSTIFGSRPPKTNSEENQSERKTLNDLNNNFIK
ncbi:UPF0001 protein [Neolecta irregularis DAH-3]|uniref:Pyridoxal phosphate homeostasis protein n=1 Tax=Neolecta irregularis (strain DAH-3) TaxID=1198029 RepID=A0A1U7LMZ2_NEOID|nr:UPF0001 protein [Neolecta irregularis DAH-3]|eukprot:OLL24036.1 UPF0001 protein [Neolecta irregularis DAH-3]